MSRYKSFEATGLAPNGRLYAGDLNAIQDMKADLSNWSQTVDVGTLRVGDASIQLLKYGSGEARLSAALRTDGILRGLGGIIPGAFTTAQRNAIPAGGAPYGIAILNSTTNRWEWNAGTDGARDWQPISGFTLPGHHANHEPLGSDAINFLNVNRRGLDNAKGSAATYAGCFYYATDTKILYQSTGVIWDQVAPAVAVSLAYPEIIYFHGFHTSNRHFQWPGGFIYDSGKPYAGRAQTATHQHDWREYDIWTAAGQWSLDIAIGRGRNFGIYGFFIDGVQVGSTDGYLNSGDTDEAQYTVDLGAITQDHHIFRVEMISKNGAANGYQGRFSQMVMYRTGP